MVVLSGGCLRSNIYYSWFIPQDKIMTTKNYYAIGTIWQSENEKTVEKVDACTEMLSGISMHLDLKLIISFL